MTTVAPPLPRWALHSQLLVAIRTNDVGRASKLLNSGSVDVDIRFTINSQEKPALCLAVENNDFPMVQLLLRLGASINQADSKRESPVHIACREGYTDIVEALLQSSRPNINARCLQGRTPLQAAVVRGSADLVDVLISHGADIDNQDKSGSTALHLAARSGRSDICTNLLNSGASASVLDSVNNMPLHDAISGACELKVIESLVQLCPQALGVTNKFGETPMILAFRSSRKDIDELLNLLLKKSRSLLPDLVWQSMILNHRTDRGHTLLHLAVLAKHIACVKILLSAGAKTDSRNHLGHTPLSSAVKIGCEETVKLLLSAGATTRTVVHNNEVNTEEPIDSEIEEMLLRAARTPLSLSHSCRRSYCRKFGLAEPNQRLPRCLKSFLKFEKADLW